MQYIQLSLFKDYIPAKDRVSLEGEIAIHTHAFAVKNLDGNSTYAMFMEVIVLETNKEYSLVRPTDRWIENCENAGNKHTKDLYLVETKNLEKSCRG